MSETPQDSTTELEDRKRDIAHQIWEKEGKPEGLAEIHWAQACLVVMELSDDEESRVPSWLKSLDDEMPLNSQITIPAAELDERTLPSISQTAEPLRSIEDLNNRLAKRSAA